MPHPMPAKTPEVFDYLKRCALEMRTVPYREIANAVELAYLGHAPLNYIRDEICIPRNLPWLSALAVSGKTRIPSPGWLPNDATIACADLPQFWRGMVLQVFATDWSAVHLDNDD